MMVSAAMMGAVMIWESHQMDEKSCGHAPERIFVYRDCWNRNVLLELDCFVNKHVPEKCLVIFIFSLDKIAYSLQEEREREGEGAGGRTELLMHIFSIHLAYIFRISYISLTFFKKYN